ncbi:MAG: response regulator [Lachnospiraceae bacterium]|nr:response regulator [Lachnospiraceae bacterium]
MNHYIIEFDYAALVIYIILLFFYYPKSSTGGNPGRSFKKLICVSASATILDILTVYVGYNPKMLPEWTVWLVNILYLCAQNLMPHVQLIYSRALVGAEKGARQSFYMIFSAVTYTASLFLIITSPALKLGFYLDGDLNYHQGPAMIVLYALALLVMAMSVLNVIINRKNLHGRSRAAIYVLVGINIVSIVIQLFLEELLIICFTSSCACLIIFVVLQNPNQAVDNATGFLTRSTLTIAIGEHISRMRGMRILLLVPDNAKTIGAVLGFEMYHTLIKEIGNYFKKQLRSDPYLVAEDCIAFVVQRDVNPEYFRNTVRRRFQKDWLVGDLEINRTCSIAIVETHGNDSTESLLNAIDYSIDRLHSIGGGVFYIAEEEAYNHETIVSLNEKMKTLEEESREAKVAREEAQRADYEKSMFLANMSHEIRTPMNAIIGMTDLILRDDINERVRANALDIKNASDSLLGIINDVLDISKVESGRLELVNDEYDLRTMLAGIVSLISTRISKNKVDFIVEIDKTMPRKLIGDEVRVRQVFVNVLNNAAKFTHEGHIKLVVRGTKENDGFRLGVRVEDTGNGIRQEDMSKLFKTFSRIEDKENHFVEGTGLGLALCKKLLNGMHGDISVRSEYGKGSVFSFDILQGICGDAPILDFDDPDEKNAVMILAADREDNRILEVEDVFRELSIRHVFCSNSEDVERAMAANRIVAVFSYKSIYSDYVDWFEGIGKPVIALFPMPGERYDDMPNVALVTEPIYSLGIARILDGHDRNVSANDSLSAPEARVLVVDDNIVNLKVVDGLLKCFDINPDSVTSGAEALERIPGGGYDLVFLDHMMPGMDGIETLEKIRKLPGPEASVCTVALTANAVNDAKQMFLEAGFDGFLSKPVDIRELERMLIEKLPERLVTLKDTVARREKKVLKLPHMSGVDTVRGIKACAGRTDRYLEVLRTFYSSGKTQYERIEKLYGRREQKELRIEVHGLKSVSASIGATDMSNLSLAMENALKNDDMKFVDTNISTLLSMYAKLLKQLQTFFEEEDDMTTERKTITLDKVRDKLALLGDALDEFDDEAACELIDGILEYGFDATVRREVRSIRDQVKIFDYNRASEMTEELIRELSLR